MLENVVYEFIFFYNRKFLFINLEFVFRDVMIVWVKEVVGQEVYKEYILVFLIYFYLNVQYEYIEKEIYFIMDGNYGKVIWEKLV